MIYSETFYPSRKLLIASEKDAEIKFYSYSHQENRMREREKATVSKRMECLGRTEDAAG